MGSGSVSAYNLVTAADSRLLSGSHQNLLMGIWCKYQNVISPIPDGGYDSIAPAWGDDSGHVALAQKNANVLCHKLLTSLVPKLNAYHRVNFNLRAWEIILGPWLTQFIGYTYRRAETLLEILQNYEVVSVSCFEFESELITSTTGEDFVAKSKNAVWQSMVDGIILNSLGQSQKINSVGKLEYSEVTLRSALDGHLSLKAKIGSAIQWVASSRMFNLRSQRFYLQATYLPYIVEIRLHLLLRQIPSIRWIASRKPLSVHKLDSRSRNSIFSIDDYSQHSKIERCIYDTAIHLIPTCYIEGLSEITSIAAKSNLPKNPKVIFTSNSFEFDEVFKVWVALKIQEGAKYIVGQHGNNYGTWVNLDLTEQRTPDVFLSWGWGNENKNILPTFNLKSSGRRGMRASGDGILLIQDMLWDPTFPRETDSEFIRRLRQQFDFVDFLDDDLRSRLTIRLHHTALSSRLNVVELWRSHLEQYPEVALDFGRSSLKKLIRSNSLVIHGYDSTGFLETLALDIPSFAFLPDGLGHLSEVAFCDYQPLLKSGLIHLDPKKAAEEAYSALSDLDMWWSSNDKIATRRIFTDKYSRISTAPAKDLKSILVKHS